MFTVAFDDAVFEAAAKAGVLSARAASAPAEIRSFFISNFPTGSKVRLSRRTSGHPWRRY